MSSSLLVAVARWGSPPPHPITSLHFLKYSPLLISGSSYGHLCYWTILEQVIEPRVFSLTHDAKITALTSLPLHGLPEVILSVSEEGSVGLSDPSGGSCLEFHPNLLNHNTHTILPLHNQLLAAASNSPDIQVLDSQMKLLFSLSTHLDWVAAIVSYPINAGNLGIISVSEGQVIRYWQVSPPEDLPLQTLFLEENHSPSPLPSSATGSYILSLSPDKFFLLFLLNNSWTVYTARNCTLVTSSRDLQVQNEEENQQNVGGSFISNSSFVIWKKSGKGIYYSLVSKKKDTENAGKPSLVQQEEEAQAVYVTTYIGGPSSNSHSIITASSESHFATADSLGKVYLWPLLSSSHSAEEEIRPALVGHVENGWENKKTEKGGITCSLVIDNTHQLVCGYESGIIEVMELHSATKKVEWQAHNSKVTALLTLPSSTNPYRSLLSGAADGCIILWHLLQDGTVVEKQKFVHHSGPITALVEQNLNMNGSVGSQTSTAFTVLPPTYSPFVSSQSNFSGARSARNQSVLTPKLSSSSHANASVLSTNHQAPHQAPSSPQSGLCVFSISEDRSVAMINIQDLTCKRVFPGHRAPIKSVRLRQDQDYLLVGCTDLSVTIWELSTGLKEATLIGQQAQEILATTEDISKTKSQTRGLSSFVLKAGDVPVQILLLNLKKLLQELYALYKPSPASSGAASTASSSLSSSSLMAGGDTSYKAFSYLLPWGLDPELDTLLEKDLLLVPPLTCLSFGLRGAEGKLSFVLNTNKTSRWQASPSFTAIHSLALMTLTKALLHISDAKNACSQLLSYVCAVMPEKSTNYIPPSYLTLARYWQDPIDDVMYSARSLFSSSIERTTPEKLSSLCLQLYTEAQTTHGLWKSLRVVALGVIGCENEGVILPENCAEEVARGLVKLLHQEGGTLLLQGAAAELLGRGYNLWSKYIEKPGQLIQKLFWLMQTSRTLREVAQASLLNIGAAEPGAFVTSLAETALNASPSSPSQLTSSSSSAAHSSSGSGNALIVISTLIKKNPLTLLPQLPKLVESIVQCLDPSNLALRESLLPSANQVLFAIVSKYPMTSFHKETQKLAVGTSKNVIHVYDLKTAVKSLILEGHRGAIAAVAFSPDGKALASYCAEDALIRLWNTSPVNNFFRFGSSASNLQKEPYNTYSIANHVQRTLTPQFLLESVRIEWVSPKKLVLKRSWEAEMVIHVQS